MRYFRYEELERLQKEYPRVYEATRDLNNLPRRRRRAPEEWQLMLEATLIQSRRAEEEGLMVQVSRHPRRFTVR